MRRNHLRLRLELLAQRIKSAARLPLPVWAVMDGRSPRRAFRLVRVEVGPVWARVSLR